MSASKDAIQDAQHKLPLQTLTTSARSLARFPLGIAKTVSRVGVLLQELEKLANGIADLGDEQRDFLGKEAAHIQDVVQKGAKLLGKRVPELGVLVGTSTSITGKIRDDTRVFKLVDVLKPYCAKDALSKVTVDDHESLIESFSDESVECTPMKPVVIASMQEAVLSLVGFITTSWTDMKSDEELKLKRSLYTCGARMRRMLQRHGSTEGVTIRAILLDLAAPHLHLQEAMGGLGTPAECASRADVLPTCTHLFTCIKRCEEQQQKQEESSDKVVLLTTEAVKLTADTAREYVEQVGTLLLHKRTECARKENEKGEKLVGTGKFGLWASKLKQSCSWSDVVKESETLLVSKGYASQVQTWIKAMQKDPGSCAMLVWAVAVARLRGGMSR